MKMYLKKIALLLALTLALASAAQAGIVHRIRIDGTINPVTAKFIMNAVERAEDANAEALIVELDTPGGLLEATRDIVQAFLAAEVPIVVYVSPAGARAGSAGVFITLAAHVAVMAPGANIGAAHPVSAGGGGMPGQEKDSTGTGVMTEKVTNDAAAMIRAIAEERNRNVEWAETSVRESASITANDALELNVIDLISPDLDALLTTIDGRSVMLPSGEKTISTTRASIENFEMSWQEKLFDMIANPNIAYILMMIGMYGVIFEITHPGAIFPGVFGTISLLLAFLAFQTLPLNTVGVLLIVLGIILLILEIKVISYGLLTIGGAGSLALGSIVLVDAPSSLMRVSLSVIIPTVIMTVLFVVIAVGFGLRAQMRKTDTGSEGIIGEDGEAIDDLNPEGMVFVHGEYWKARAPREVLKGKKVRVTDMDKMILIVEEIQNSDL